MNQPKPTVFNYNDYLALKAENAELKQQLAASQRRERAAEETLDEIYERTKPGGKEGGYSYGGTTCIGADVYRILTKWRGPQAGKGDAE